MDIFEIGVPGGYTFWVATEKGIKITSLVTTTYVKKLPTFYNEDSPGVAFTIRKEKNDIKRQSQERK